MANIAMPVYELHLNEEWRSPCRAGSAGTVHVRRADSAANVAAVKLPRSVFREAHPA